MLRIVDGSVGIRIATVPPIDRHLTPGDTQPIPPRVPHDLAFDEAVVFTVDFLVAAR